MNLKSVAIILISMVLIIPLVSHVDLYNHAYAIEKGIYDVPVFLRLLGEGRSVVSNISILQADMYMHGGVGHLHDEDEEEGHGGVAGLHDEHEEEEHLDEDHLLRPGKYNVLLRISQEIAVHEHKHLQGDDIREIIPWLYYAAEVDPHNTLAYTLTAFYLADRLGKVDEAVSFLREGLRKNPTSWEINAELGRIYFHDLENYEASSEYFSRAWDFLQNEPHDKFEERRVLGYLAMAYEQLGEEGKAVPIYRHLNDLFPHSVYEKKLKFGK